MATYVENGEERLTSEDNLLVKHDRCGAGRRDGDTEIPDFLRKLIGITTKVSGPTKAAKVFGVSQPTASTAARGEISPGVPNPELKAHINEKIADARERAVQGVLSALNLVPEKIDGNVKLKDLTQVAKDLSFVADKLAPADEKMPRGAQVIFYTPPAAQLESYDIIDIKPTVVE